MTQTAQEGVFLGDWLWWTPQKVVPSRWNSHIPFFAWLFATLRPALCVELGSHSGESFRALCQIADRFSPGGRLVGVDQWASHPRPRAQGQSRYDELDDYCMTCHASSAALVRMDINEAAGEFADHSVDLLHIATLSPGTEIGGLDLAAWAPKLRPGAVVAITGHCPELDDASRKAWQQLADWYPATMLGLPNAVGLAQSPVSGDAPLVALLSDQESGVSSLFRSLGERIEYRHLIGSEPTSAAALRRYISDLMDQHAEDVRRIEGQHRLAREDIERELKSASERLVQRANEVRSLESEIDMLMAKVAAQAAVHDRQLQKATDDLAHLQWKHSTETAQLLHKMATEAEVLHAEIAKREEYIQALTQTTSWRVTKPLRALQSIRLKTARRPR